MYMNKSRRATAKSIPYARLIDSTSSFVKESDKQADGLLQCSSKSDEWDVWGSETESFVFSKFPRDYRMLNMLYPRMSKQ